MAWGRIDDNLALHPKVMQAGNEAMGLWVRSLSYSCQQLTDGFISDSIVAVLGSHDVARELVMSGLWHGAEGGYQFNDWHDYQPTRETVLAEKDASRLRMAKMRATKAERSANVRENEQRTNGERSGDVTEKFGRSSEDVRLPHPIPSHPIPTSKEVTKSVAPRKRGTRIPEPFMVTTDMRAWAASRVPGVDVTTATEKFANYWRASTKNATKLDWTATWNNWLLSDFETRVQNRKPTPEERAHRTLALATDIDMREISA